MQLIPKIKQLSGMVISNGAKEGVWSAVSSHRRPRKESIINHHGPMFLFFSFFLFSLHLCIVSSKLANNDDQGVHMLCCGRQMRKERCMFYAHSQRATTIIVGMQ